MTIDPNLPPLSGGEHCYAVNVSGSLAVAGTSVVIVGGPAASPAAGQQAPFGVPVFEFSIPSGPVLSGSLGVLDRDVAAGDTGVVVVMGIVGALSDSSATLNQPLTISTAGKLKLATVSGVEVVGFGASAPGSVIWAHLCSPFPLP